VEQLGLGNPFGFCGGLKLDLPCGCFAIICCDCEVILGSRGRSSSPGGVEDKTDTKDHSEKLERYREAVARGFPGHRIAAVYLKTGDQCDYRSAEQAGYGCFLRRDVLEVFQRGEAWGVTNDIFADFHRHLRNIEQAVQGFATVSPGGWGGGKWRGFFMALREKLGNGEWFHFRHGGGGTPTFRWHKRGDKFLRLGGGQLAFKVEAEDESDRKGKGSSGTGCS
jgi:hypothetical protein